MSLGFFFFFFSYTQVCHFVFFFSLHPIVFWVYYFFLITFCLLVSLFIFLYPIFCWVCYFFLYIFVFWFCYFFLIPHGTYMRFFSYKLYQTQDFQKKIEIHFLIKLEHNLYAFWFVVVKIMTCYWNFKHIWTIIDHLNKSVGVSF